MYWWFTKQWWDVLKNQVVTTWELWYGVWQLNKLHRPIVSIFGGARLHYKSPYFKQAHDLAETLVKHDYSVITGGGPGIMNAANDGARHGDYIGYRSMGITVKGLGELNFSAQLQVKTSYFFSRKWLLTHYSEAYVVFPGGFGTLDELAEVTTLIQTKRIEQRPIVLFGKKYWQDFMLWLHESAFKDGLVSQEDIQLIKSTDSIDEALCLIRGWCELVPYD